MPIHIDEFSVKPLYLETYLNNSRTGIATGFVVKRNNSYYLVTNWHVVTGRNPNNGQPLPQLIWEYVTTADEMFIDGHFIGVMLLCASIVELSLTDQLISRAQMVRKETERLGLEQMTILAHRLGIITNQEKGTIDKLRKSRNALIHVKAGEIAKMGRNWYQVPPSDHSKSLERGLYLKPLSEGKGIAGDALKYLAFTRDLTSKFYGAQP